MKAGVPCIDGLRRTQGDGRSKTIAFRGGSTGPRATKGEGGLDVCATESGWESRWRFGGEKTRGPEVTESDPQGQRASQLLLVQTPRTKPPARGKSFNQGFVYLSSRLVAASCT